MQTDKLKNITIPDIALIAATRGIIGLGAGLLLANKLPQTSRKTVGWSLFIAGLASTIPIAMHLFANKPAPSSTDFQGAV